MAQRRPGNRGIKADACLPLLTEAATLYTGDFLADFTLRDSPEFDDWQFFQTKSLRQNLALVLKRLVHGLSAQGEYEAAIPSTQRCAYKAIIKQQSKPTKKVWPRREHLGIAGILLTTSAI